MSQKIRPPNWKELAPPIPNFVHQSSTLPRLPVPPLLATLERLKCSLRPLAWSTEEFASVCEKIDDFAHPDGPGQILQQLLLQRENERDNWLEEWYDDWAHLAERDSIADNVSPCCSFEPQPMHLPQTPAARAAGITRGVMLLRQRLRSCDLTPDTFKNDPLCMDAYRWMFDCSRVPGIEGRDWCVSYAASPNPDSDLGHVIVIRKNRFWKLKAQVGDKVLGMGDLISQFQFIYDHSMDEYPAIGALSAQQRDIWAKDFSLLSSVPHNAAILREIHASAFVVSLDDSTPPPESDVDVLRTLRHGTLSPANLTGVSRGLSSRYVDKPIQFIIFDNAIAGNMGEHSILDGTHSIRVCEEVFGFLADPQSDFQLSPSPSITTHPNPLDFDLASIPDMYEALSKSQQFVHQLASSWSLSLLRTNYGKAAIKSFGISPDAWAQMILQVAYARLAQRFAGRVMPWPVGTGEAAMTRKFYKGRTEIIEVVSDESVAFVRVMLGHSATRDEKVRLLKDAAKKHRQLTSEAMMGEGVNGHMLGLCLSKPSSMPAPALLTDSLFTRFSQHTLATSTIHNKYIRLTGWGAVVSDGFGVPYMTGFEDYLQFTVTSRAEMPNAEFAEEIKKAAEDFYELFANEARQDSATAEKQSHGVQ